MATLNLGRIKPVFRGAYAGGTAYVIDDIVTSGGETFICIQASTGNATSSASHWTKLAEKGTNGTNGTDVGTTLTTQGDILYRDGSGLARLGYGTAGQVLKTGGSGANPSWTTVSGDLSASGSTQNVYKFQYTTSFTTSSTSFVNTGVELETPQLTTNMDFIVHFTEARKEQNWNQTAGKHQFSVDGGSNWQDLNTTASSYTKDGNSFPEGNQYETQSGSYYLDFTSGQTPWFKIVGRMYSGSNPYQLNQGHNRSSIVAIKVTP